MPYILSAAAIIVIDGISKWYIGQAMTVGDTIDVINGFFAITYVKNDGIAFGMLGGKVSIMIILTGLLLIAILAYLIKNRSTLHPFMAYGLAFVIGGGTGNLIDRIFNGYVVDFLDFKIWPPVFNIADIFVCVGCGMVIIYLLFMDRGKDERSDTENQRG